MPSAARLALEARLRDVDELVEAHHHITGGGAGRPAARQGAAVTRAGVVLLAAALEGFVEDLFEEAAKLLFKSMPSNQLAEFLKQTSGKLNNADVLRTNLLYFNLGLAWVLDSIRWQKMPNTNYKRLHAELIERRNQIAHGRQPNLRLQSLRKWRQTVAKSAEVLERRVAEHVGGRTGQFPDW